MPSCNNEKAMFPKKFHPEREAISFSNLKSMCQEKENSGNLLQYKKANNKVEAGIKTSRKEYALNDSYGRKGKARTTPNLKIPSIIEISAKKPMRSFAIIKASKGMQRILNTDAMTVI